MKQVTWPKKGQSKWNQLNFFKQIISSKCQTRANVANEWTNLLHQWTDPTRLWIFLLLWQVPLADEISFSRPDGASSAWRSPENSSRTSGSSTIDAHARLPWLRQSTFTQSKTFNRLTLDLEIIKTAAKFEYIDLRRLDNIWRPIKKKNFKFIQTRYWNKSEISGRLVPAVNITRIFRSRKKNFLFRWTLEHVLNGPRKQKTIAQFFFHWTGSRRFCPTKWTGGYPKVNPSEYFFKRNAPVPVLLQKHILSEIFPFETFFKPKKHPGGIKMRKVKEPSDGQWRCVAVAF